MEAAEKHLPELIESKRVYHGRIFDVSIDKIKEGEKTYEREVVHHPGSAVIVPVFADRTVGLVRQYRHAVLRYLLEIPAGSLSDSEAPEEGAARELEEEIGVVAGRMEKLAEFFPSPGFCAEKMWLFLATDLRPTKQKLEDDEVVEIVREPFSRIFEMISNGDIQDAKTILGTIMAAEKLKA